MKELIPDLISVGLDCLQPLEVKAGMDLIELKKTYGDKLSLTTSLIQADMFGISLGKILRIQSEELRRRQSETAEKLAMKASVKLLLPLVGFIFPAVFIVLLGPILLQLLWGGF